MVNDVNTLNGALAELGETLADNLVAKGVSASANDGLTTLANAILDIEQGSGGQEIVSFDNLTTEFNYTRKRGSYGFSVTIPSGVTSLGTSCFSNCDGLTSVTIPSGVTSLGTSCFRSCSGLTSVTIPSGVTSLGTSCFQNCKNLTSVTIPSSVTSLGSDCFRGCTNLVDYQLYWENPPITWSSTLMPNNTNTYFTIPNGTTANYVAKSFPSAKLVERSG